MNAARLKSGGWVVFKEIASFFLISHASATGWPHEILPGLEGEWVNLRESTADMTKKRSSSLIDYTQAYGDLHDVAWTEQAQNMELETA